MWFLNKKFALTVGKLLLAGLIFGVLIKSSLINFSLFKNVFHSPLLILELLGIFLCMVILGAWRWYLLNAAQNLSLGFKGSIKPTYIASAFNALLPGAVGGDFVRCHYVFKRIPDRKSAILLTIFFDRVIGLMGILATLCLIALTHVTFFYQQKELFYLLAITMGVCLGLFALFMALMIVPQRLGLQHWLSKRFPYHQWTKTVAKYLDTFCSYRVPRWVLIQALILSVLIQCLVVAALMLVANLLNLPAISFSYYAIAVGITLLVSLIPLTPGGVGVGEMAFANVLVLLNPQTTIAYGTIYLGYRLLTILTYLPAVFFYLPGFRLIPKKELEFK